MLFNSFTFIIFFPLVVLIYLICPKRLRYLWLLITSYYFYMSWNPKYAILIGISTLITYISGVLLGKASKLWHRKLIVAGSFLTNLSILIFFKYFTFLLDTVNKLFDQLNMSALSNPFDIILPVGISFYTFQALSYTMDVYRKEIDPEKNILKYALFVSFFPQLVAGPIERSKNLLVQISQVPLMKLWDYNRITKGLTLMAWGFFQKMVIADRLALIVNPVFDSYEMYGTIPLVIAAVGFSLQVYCDFASYSSIAIGAAQVMGFTLMENFDTPFFSKSIKELWQRWHISLGSWFRDYLYIPLGGNRCSKGRRRFNLMVTFLASGLWHGANWTFIVWGALQGFFQIIGEITRPIKDKINAKLNTKTSSFSYQLAQICTTFGLFTFSFIFFRSNSIGDALHYIKRIFTRFDIWCLFDNSLYAIGLTWIESNLLLFGLIILLLISLVKYFKNQRIDEFLSKQCIWFRYGVILTFIVGAIVFGVYGIDLKSVQFLYFQF